MKKWMYELIALVILVCVGLGIWWFVATKDSRLAEAQYQQLFKYAQRQALEIAVIEQASKLENYKQQMEKNKAALTVPQTVPAEPNNK